MKRKKKSSGTREIANRTEKGQFAKGESGNPDGRPKGAKNQITLLKQSLELELRQAAEPELKKVLAKAVELALEGHPGMIKLLLELHMSKGASDESKAAERVAIQINSSPREIVTIVDKSITIEEDNNVDAK